MEAARTAAAVGAALVEEEDREVERDEGRVVEELDRLAALPEVLSARSVDLGR